VEVRSSSTKSIECCCAEQCADLGKGEGSRIMKTVA